MRHIPTENPFHSSDKFPGATLAARRALAGMNLESPSMQRLLATCKALKLKVECPVWRSGAAAHIGIPGKKVAIYTRSFADHQGIERARQKWEALGWAMLSITSGSVERLSDAMLAKHLSDAIKVVTK